MRKIKPKDYVSYVPYGVHVMAKGGVHKVNGLSFDCTALWVEIGKEYQFLFQKEMNFILRPLHSLTDTITYNGKRIIPLIEMAKKATSILEGWRVVQSAVVNGDEDDQYRFGYSRHGFELYHATLGSHRSYDLVFNQVDLFDMMDEMLFDYRDLIRDGLAIDCTTLEKNPYETDTSN